MKKFVLIAVLLLAVPCMGGELSYVTLSLSALTANNTTNTSTYPISGVIKSIEFDVTGTSATQAVSVVSRSGNAAEETILAVALLAADAKYRPLAPTHLNTTGAANANTWTEIFVASEKLELRAARASTNTPQSVTAKIVFEE